MTQRGSPGGISPGRGLWRLSRHAPVRSGSISAQEKGVIHERQPQSRQLDQPHRRLVLCPPRRCDSTRGCGADCREYLVAVMYRRGRGLGGSGCYLSHAPLTPVLSHAENDRNEQTSDFRRRFEIRTFGAEDAHFFELLGNIADWLFTNKIEDAFRIPKLSVTYLQEQRLQENYLY